ncbi:MAG: prepilin-type N-terminal cleavage/methylation domain-containing protein [Terriglobales bacterium]|jgi:general secretion pathway protein G
MKFRSKAGNSSRNSKVRNRGFTLMEMAVVITLILILVAIAVPMYTTSITRAKEAKLHQNLTTLNKVIQEYSLDKKHAPQSLEDLVPGYIKFIPEDITGSTDWVLDQEDSEDQWDPNQSGIKGVHSASNEISSEGTPYSSWTH